MNKLLKVCCPHCDKVFSYYESEFRPFCTERCKMIDLGHWFQENYRVPDKGQEPNRQNNESNQSEEKDDCQNQNQNQREDEDDENNY